MVKRGNACGDGEYYFGSGISASEGADLLGASTDVDCKSTRRTVAEHS
jgi:hypothetical protein